MDKADHIDVRTNETRRPKPPVIGLVLQSLMEIIKMIPIMMCPCWDEQNGKILGLREVSPLRQRTLHDMTMQALRPTHQYQPHRFVNPKLTVVNVPDFAISGPLSTAKYSLFSKVKAE